jgi:hypothetical protein
MISYTVERFDVKRNYWGVYAYELQITGGVLVKQTRQGNVHVQFPEATKPIPGCPWWRALFKPGDKFICSQAEFARAFDPMFVIMCRAGFQVCSSMSSHVDY